MTSGRTKATGAPLRSMTGYAQARRQTESGELALSLRSVNHRGLDLHFHLAPELLPFETAMRAVLKERIGRGHVEIRASHARAAQGAGAGFNKSILKSYLAAFQSAAEELGLDSKPDLNVLVGMPGVAGSAEGEAPALDAAFQSLLTGALEECVDRLNQAREREGGELRKALLEELAQIERARDEMAKLRGEVVASLADRLREKLTDLLKDAKIPEARLAEEAAILADRSDIEEELTRLAIHARELRRIVEAGGAVGKPLDFLLQELNRETNTTLSKSAGGGETALKLTNLGLAVKANIERIREQALNLE